MSSNTLILTPIDGEPRIHDLLLAERLGFTEPRAIRKLIKRNIKKLEAFGHCATVSRVTITGQPSKEYYLNKKQSAFIAMKSETDKAFEVQEDIIHVYDAYLNGELRPIQSSPQDQAFKALASHTRRPIQVHHSKLANAVMAALGGVDKIRQYNRRNVLLQSGKTPSEWKRQAKAEGMKARHRSSGKEVLRVKQPHVACGLSLADQLVAGGAAEIDGISIGKDSQTIFQRILALGITPAELLL